MEKDKRSIMKELEKERAPIRVNFAPALVPLVRSGEKFLTWRINDEKGFQVDDELVLWMKGKDELGTQVEAEKSFGKAKVVDVWEKRFEEFGEKELTGHEKFGSREEMIHTYQRYYGPEVSEDTLVKIIKFKMV
jgi:hypothetical protein